MKKIYLLAILLLNIGIMVSCGGAPSSAPKTTSQTQSNTIKTQVNTNLNISILLDLSDRINPSVNPSEAMSFHQRDIEYIRIIAEALKNHVTKKKIRTLNDKIQIYIEPTPSNSNINSCLTKCKQTFNEHNVTKDRLKDFVNTYVDDCSKIYDIAIKSDRFDGSDIWGFFKNKIGTCIGTDQRNILVILTDGYLYDKTNCFQKGTQYSYLTTRLLATLGLKKSNWHDLITKNGYGLIPSNNDLNNIEVIVLGINGNSRTPFEEDVIKKFISDWFTNMGVVKSEIYSTDLPVNLEQRIINFIQK